MNYKYAGRYLNYLITSRHRKGHGVHSPFVFDLITNVFLDDAHYSAYDDIENVRNKMLDSEELIEVTDYGAGSSVFKSNTRKIKKIAKVSVQSKKYGQLLYRIVRHYKPRSLIELGTSIGITSLYLAAGNPRGVLYTLEGCRNTSEVAKKNFNNAGVLNLKSIVGRFEDMLTEVLAKEESFDFVYIDGNHAMKPTLDSFKLCLSKSDENSIFVIDDIHWSGDMEQAWKTIKECPDISQTIDLFSLGIVFFKKGVARQDFIIRY